MKTTKTRFEAIYSTAIMVDSPNVDVQFHINDCPQIEVMDLARELDLPIHWTNHKPYFVYSVNDNVLISVFGI